MGTTMSLEALLRGAVDYGGLYPPAELSMNAAVEHYARYRAGPHRWMLGKFVVGSSRLNALDNHLASIGSDDVWPVSVVCSGVDEVDSALAATCALVEIRSLEVKLSGPADVRSLSKSRPSGVELFVEPRAFLASESVSDWLDPLKACEASLKVRTGGSRAEQIPTSEQLAWVIRECAARRLRLKATAGLHHPIGNGSHGFLNVLMASAVALEGASASDLEELLDDDEPDAFVFEDTHAVWQHHVLRMESITASRELLLRCFGSCSFEEPVGGLEELGFIESSPKPN